MVTIERAAVLVVRMVHVHSHYLVNQALGEEDVVDHVQLLGGREGGRDGGGEGGRAYLRRIHLAVSILVPPVRPALGLRNEGSSAVEVVSFDNVEHAGGGLVAVHVGDGAVVVWRE